MVHKIIIHGSMSCSTRFIKTATEHMKNLKIGEYIIQSLVDKNINTGFGYKTGPYSPIYEYANNHTNFDIVFEEYEQNSAHKAITYSSVNNLGVIFSTSPNGLDNIMVPIRLRHKVPYPLLLLSFFESDAELNYSQFISNTKSLLKESITINTPEDFSSIMEETISYGHTFPPGHIHLNIANNILDKSINLVVEKKSKKQINKDSLVQKYLGCGAESHSSIPFTKLFTSQISSSDLTQANVVGLAVLPSCRNCLICGTDTLITKKYYGKMKLYKCCECGWLS